MENDNSRESKKLDRKAMWRNNLLERRNEAKIIRRIVAIIALIIILAAAGAAFGGYHYINASLSPVDPDNNKQTDIEIPIGSSTTSIGKLLEENGIIKNGTIFKYYVKFNNISGFQAGKYSLTPSMTLDEISKTLQTGKLVREALFKITIPEGLWLSDIAAIIEKHTDYSKEEIVKKLDDPETIEQLIKKHPDLLTESILNEQVIHPLEGYLFPATYPFYEEKPSLDSIIDVMLNQTKAVIAKYTDEMSEEEMDVHQLLTLASLIEKEATQKTDRDLISSVFHNRMKIEMPLQTDPTVAYAQGRHLERTVYADLEFESPYNTYKYKGLPPGPIANAGAASIEAALSPAESKFFYFLAAKGTGDVYYAETLEEHNKLKAEHITNK